MVSPQGAIMPAQTSERPSARQRANANGAAGAVRWNAPRLSSAERIAGQIRRNVVSVLDAPDAPAFDVNVAVIESIITASFWSGVRSKIYLLTSLEDLVQFPAVEGPKFLRRRHGSPVDIDELAKVEMDAAARKKLAGCIEAAVFGPIIDQLKYANQRDAVEWHVDMFAKAARMELVEDRVSITLTHRPLTVDASDADDTVMADYREHFPELDDVLAFIVAGRFALDRKKAYLWMQCASDWGKGLLLGALSDLGLVVQMSTTEIEAAFDGKPVGRRPEDFKRAFVLAVDEFKSVKSELKQLQSEMWIAPKHQLTAKVDLYTKLFLSAENVASLVSDHGVEDQFANRMSIITASGNITARPMFDGDGGAYFRAIRAHIGSEINRLVADYQRLGRHGAELRASVFWPAPRSGAMF